MNIKGEEKIIGNQNNIMKEPKTHEISTVSTGK